MATCGCSSAADPCGCSSRGNNGNGNFLPFLCCLAALSDGPGLGLGFGDSCGNNNNWLLLLLLLILLGGNSTRNGCSDCGM